jgi:oligopeptide/dipeptide ABC transporter ATP-binding protein
MSVATKPLLRVGGLSKTFHAHGAFIRAVHNVSFELERGRTLALVGESGCGKSTTGRLVLRLIEPSAGRVELAGADIAGARGKALTVLRRSAQIVFQDPMGSLNPRMTIGAAIAEPLLVHGVPARERKARVAELLREVELGPEYASRYPHELSGGQRQRVAIARALALRPQVIVADEPVSALDASIQSQVLALLLRLQREHGISYLFISHDLSVVRYLAHEVAVMYLGEIVERGPTEELFGNPRHPYTQALLRAIPLPLPDAPQVAGLEGSVPSAMDSPAGCPFITRCPYAMEKCEQPPPPFAVGPQHSARCWLNETLASGVMEVR